MAGLESARHLQAQVQTGGGRAQGETQVRETGVSEERYLIQTTFLGLETVQVWSSESG